MSAHRMVSNSCHTKEEPKISKVTCGSQQIEFQNEKHMSWAINYFQTTLHPTSDSVLKWEGRIDFFLTEKKIANKGPIVPK